ncbi:DUF3945 domain-containing protein [Larkinella insperata]|uniref:DUF3945 domain-containing protein n=1 Tax=Larkinella insperata TaxID=332158 RepID=A0ABW3QG19_9BACT
MQDSTFARSQAEAIDNLAPTQQQAAAATQYAITDGYLASAEQEAIIKQISAERAQLQKKLDEVGITREFLAANPDVEKALASGKATSVLILELPNDLQLQGRLRIAITEQGPQLRVTPVHETLLIPDRVGDIRLTQQEREELKEKGFVHQAIQMPEKGGFVAGFLRVDKETNTVDVWRVNPETLPSKLLGIDLTRDQQIALACGHAVKLSGLKDQKGEPYDATVSLNVSRQSLQFSDLSRPGVSITTEDKFKPQLALNNEGAKTDQVHGLEQKTGHTITSNAQQNTIKQSTPEDDNQTKKAGPKLRAS